MADSARGIKACRWGFAGGKPQSLTILEALASVGRLPAFVAGSSDLPAHDREELHAWSKRVGVTCFDSRDLSERQDTLASLDLLLVCRFGLLSEPVFAAPKMGTVNVHSSLLPKYRGIHPVSWALVRGEPETGVSFHRISAGVDTGDILLQEATRVWDSDDIWSLTSRLNALSGRLAQVLFEHIARGGALPPGRPQGECPFYARRRKPEDGHIDWQSPSRNVFNLVRALRPPLPPAFCFDPDGNKVEVFDCIENGAQQLPNGQPRPGTVLGRSGGRYVVGTKSFPILISTSRALQPGHMLQ